MEYRSVIIFKIVSSHHSLPKQEKEMFYLTTHATHFFYGHMTSNIW